MNTTRSWTRRLTAGRLEEMVEDSIGRDFPLKQGRLQLGQVFGRTRPKHKKSEQEFFPSMSLNYSTLKYFA